MYSSLQDSCRIPSPASHGSCGQDGVTSPRQGTRYRLKRLLVCIASRIASAIQWPNCLIDTCSSDLVQQRPRVPWWTMTLSVGILTVWFCTGDSRRTTPFFLLSLPARNIVVVQVVKVSACLLKRSQNPSTRPKCLLRRRKGPINGVVKSSTQMRRE